VRASPYACAYSEKHETRPDISDRVYRTTRSFTVFTYRNIPTENVLHFPVPEFMIRSANSSTGRAKIINYACWEKKMTTEPDGNEKDGQEASEVTDRQMLSKIVELASTDNLPDEALREMVEALEKIADTYKRKED